MTALLLLAVLVMGAMLAETRSRLASLERRFTRELWERDAEQQAAVQPPQADPPVARIVARAVPKAAASVPLVAKASPEPAPVEAPIAPAAAELPAAEMPAAEPDAWPEQEAANTVRFDAAPPFAINFEDLFGRKLPIWAGGVTLLVAAVFLVRYSIEAGLLSPAVRVTLGLLFGFGLLGGAEAARRRADLVQDPRVAQALAGAGIGALYAATLAAANLYALVGPATAFVGLAAITAAAGALALRFGAPCAVLGLVGGLATPALIQTGQPNAPLLAGYVAILIAGLSLLSRRQRWIWLGIGALAGGSLWSLVMIVIGAGEGTGAISAGLLVLVLGLALPMVSAGACESARGQALLRTASAGVAALQLALLVALGGFTALTWGLYGLLSLALLWLSRSLAELRRLLLLPLLTALGLLLLWASPQPALFGAVLLGIVLIYGGHALWHLRGPDDETQAGLDAVSLAAIGLGGYVAIQVQLSPAPLAATLTTLALAVLPAVGAAILWRVARQPDREPFALAAYAASLLLGLAWLAASPTWAAPIGLAGVAVLTLLVAIGAGNRWLGLGALTLQLAAIVALGGAEHFDAEMTRLFAAGAQPDLAQALLRWGTTCAAGAVFAWAARREDRIVRWGRPLQALAALLGYGLLAQVVPAAWLALGTAAVTVAVALFDQRRETAVLAPSLLVFCGLTGLWTLEPVLQWAGAGAASLGGTPLLVGVLPDLGEALRRLLGPALLAGLALHLARNRPSPGIAGSALGVAGAIGLMGLHVLYKQVFAIASIERFVTMGLAERTVWDMLLIGAGWAAWRWAGQRRAAVALIGAGLAHGLVYTVLLHNPLWDAQAVGTWPLVNLLIPAYGALLGALWALPRIPPLDRPEAHRLADLARMVLVLLLAVTSLRQAFVGSLPAQAPIGWAEDIGWSLTAIVLAIGYLLWGIRSARRDWRLASLVLMLVAVGKVFIFDAAGLDGLARIASFLALGFSLIGIGWLYSRFLKTEPATALA